MSEIPSADDFAVGDRFENNLDRALTITGVDVEAGTITYVYDAGDWYPVPTFGARPANQTVGWRKL